MDWVFPLKWHEKNVNIGKNDAINFFFSIGKNYYMILAMNFSQHTTFLQYNC